MSTPRETARLDRATRDWIRDTGGFGASIVSLTGDVSPRRYYRVRSPSGASAILATYPEDDRGSSRPFSEISSLLSRQGVPVPEILATDSDSGRMLLQDLGDETLYDRRSRGWSYLTPHIELAASLVPRIAALPAAAIERINPPLDRSLMARELRTTWTLALGTAELTRTDLSAALAPALGTMLDQLADAPRAVCHRDYMARNLMPSDADSSDDESSPSAGLWVIDHQDARLGPHTYDLASLLNDSLFAPAELEASLLDRYLDSQEERLDYHRAAAQRTLKIIGTYLGFAVRGEPRHLHLVAPSLERARQHLARLPELAGQETAFEDLGGELLSAARRLSEGDTSDQRTGLLD